MFEIMFSRSAFTMKTSSSSPRRLGKIRALCLLPLILLFVISCRSVGSSYNKGNDSQLAGVYDETTLLRLSAAPGKPGLFRFETCLKDQQQNVTVAKEGSCIGALRSIAGEDITFTLVAIEPNSLGSAEKAYLQELQSDWQSYQKKLRAQAMASNVGGGVASTAAVTIGLSATLKSKEQRLLVALQKALQSKHPTEAEELTRESIAEVERMLRRAGLIPEYVKATDDLSSLAGARPAGVLVGEGGDLVSLVGKSGEQSILTPNFRNYFRKAAESVYLEIGAGHLRSADITQGKLDELAGDLVQNYLDDGGKSLNDIFEPRWLNGFFKYQRIEAAMGAMPYVMRDANELTAALKRAPALVLQSAQEYVFHGAMPPTAKEASAGLAFMRGKLIANKSNTLSRIAQAQQRIRRLAINRIGIVIALFAAAAGGAFVALQVDNSDKSGGGFQGSQIEVLMDDKSALMSQDSTNNAQVSSVRQVLGSVSLYLKSRAAFDPSLADNLRIHHYCWPRGAGQGNRESLKCQIAPAYQ